MEQTYRILDSENGVAACTVAEMPEKYREDIVKQGGELSKLTFYFDKEHDLIVLNEDCEYYEQYRDLILEMMSGTEDLILKVFDKLSDENKAEFKELCTILLVVKKYRALKEGSSHAEE